MAILMGAGGYEGFEDECGKLTQRQLRALGGRKNPKTGRCGAPSDTTFFRVIDGLEAAGFDLRIGQWMMVQEISILQSLAIDGKCLRGSGRGDGNLGAPLEDVLPAGAVGALVVPDIPSLHRLLRRAFQLSKSLPDELLHVFMARTANLPRTTEVERLVVQRVGQDIFREGLLEFWEGRCAITGLAVPELLRTSHIKPWAACETDAERLDVYNGLLLAPHLDAAFDLGYITVADNGEVICSPALGERACQLLGMATPMALRASAGDHHGYLQWHRERVFKGHGGQGLTPVSVTEKP